MRTPKPSSPATGGRSPAPRDAEDIQRGLFQGAIWQPCGDDFREGSRAHIQRRIRRRVILPALPAGCPRSVVAVGRSRANQDGGRGLRTVKERGGMTIVQNPDTTEFSEMPAAARDTAEPDQILWLGKSIAFPAAGETSFPPRSLDWRPPCPLP